MIAYIALYWLSLAGAFFIAFRFAIMSKVPGPLPDHWFLTRAGLLAISMSAFWYANMSLRTALAWSEGFADLAFQGGLVAIALGNVVGYFIPKAARHDL